MLFGSSHRLKKGGNLLNVMCEGNKLNVVTHKYPGIVIDNHLDLNVNFYRSYKRVNT